MLFSSFEFIFLFLPLTFLGYFFLPVHKRLFLCLTSLFFYAWWDVRFVPLITASILVNYFLGKSLSKTQSRPLLWFGVALNLASIGYFKYSGFIFDTLHLSIDKPILPLAISFFTFQQIAFLVDCAKRKAGEYDLINYTLFVSFFPQLIAGPIVHHREILPQFEASPKISFDHVARGIFLFSLGLFKKVIIADNLSFFVHTGFEHALHIPFFQAWVTALAYTFQLYYDFSGYSDMAIGAALLFNIKLCLNFNSPYKANSIQDFWQRWHMSLSRFLKEYLYIPLGGNRGNHLFICRNLFITFLLAGIWHGAGWTFIIWGALHGLAMMVHRTWKMFNLSMPNFLGWLLTFFFVTVAWVFFRAQNIHEALSVISGMFGLNGFHYVPFIEHKDVTVVESAILFFILVAAAWVAFRGKQAVLRFEEMRFNRRELLVASSCFIFSFMFMAEGNDFLYFNF